MSNLFESVLEIFAHRQCHPPLHLLHSIHSVFLSDSDKAKVLEKSNNIRKEITKSDNLRNIVKLAYTLPLGGIAFHFKSNNVIHQNLETIGFAKIYN
jgi:hypothetical protein